MSASRHPEGNKAQAPRRNTLPGRGQVFKKNKGRDTDRERQANCRTIEMRAFDEKILEYIIKMERMKSDSAVTPIVAEVCWLSWAPTVMKKSRFTAVNVCEDGRLNVRLGLCRGLNGDDQSPQFFPPREDDTFR